MIFPPNPSNGTIFESSPGIFYQFSSITQSWYRISRPSIPVATEFTDGLMSSEDFAKITGLLVPPPAINLGTEDCTRTYNRGLIAITGDTTNVISVDVKEENLHENTSIVDFKVNTDKLVQKLVNLGQLSLASPQGATGDAGVAGEDGANSLPVGPQGPDGADGKNAVWPGTLSIEDFNVAQEGRAIVDISTQSDSADENYIVVKRANIGNPEACPSSIVPQNIQSPWILAFSYSTSTPTVVTDSSGRKCGWACGSDLYYFDIDAIVQSIHTQWLSYMAIVKAEKEALAVSWLNAMMAQFNQQKAAICCALEACQSRTRNVQTRQYIEQQRIQAMTSDLKLTIGGENDKVYPPPDGLGNDCGWNIAPTNYNLQHLSDPLCQIDWYSICGT